MLSGAVLFNSLRHNNGRFIPLAREFQIRRFLRIYPALFACLVVCAIVFPVAGIPVTLGSFLRNAALYEITVNGATWTLNVEFIAASFLLLAFLGYRVGGEWVLFAVCVGLAIFFKAAWLEPYMVYFKQFWICFALGALIPTTACQWLIGRLPKWSWIVALLGVIIFKSTLQHVLAAFLVAVLYYGNGASLGSFLESPVSVFLGQISYSLYLFNVVFLEVICHYFRSQAWAVMRQLEIGFPVSILIIAATIPIAWLSLKLIEAPSIQLGRSVNFTRDHRQQF